MCKRQLPTGDVPTKADSGDCGRNVPTNGGVPAVMAVAAESSNVVRLASALPVSKLAPAPLAVGNGTVVPSGAINEKLKSESIGATSRSETATLVIAPPVQNATLLVDSMVPMSGTLVTMLLSNRVGAADSPEGSV